MKCWKCSKEIESDLSSCIYCGANQHRSVPSTTEGTALRKIYDAFGCEEVLRNPVYICSGLKDLLPDAEVLCKQIKAAYMVGLGDEYYSQINLLGKTNEVFYNKVKRLLTDDMGFSDVISEKLILFFDEMVGWETSTRTISMETAKPIEKIERPVVKSNATTRVTSSTVKAQPVPVVITPTQEDGPAHRVIDMSGKQIGTYYETSKQILDMKSCLIFNHKGSCLINIRSKARYDVQQTASGKEYIIDSFGTKIGYIEPSQVNGLDMANRNVKIDNAIDDKSNGGSKKRDKTWVGILIIVAIFTAGLFALLIERFISNRNSVNLPDRITEKDFITALDSSGVCPASDIEVHSQLELYSYRGYLDCFEAYSPYSGDEYELYLCFNEEDAEQLFRECYEVYESRTLSKRCIRKIEDNKEYVYVDQEYLNSLDREEFRFTPTPKCICRIGKTVIFVFDGGEPSQDEINGFLDAIGLPHT